MKTKFVKSTLMAAAIAAAALAAMPASAHGRHGHGTRLSLGFVFGAPAFYGPRYYAPYPYYRPYYPYPAEFVVPYASPPAPTVYIERESAQSAPTLPPGYWYYCAESQAYYPYVKQCAGAWQQVAPQPAS